MNKDDICMWDLMVKKGGVTVFVSTVCIITICLTIRPDNLLVSQRLFLERTTESHQVFVKMDCIHQSMFQLQLKPDHRHKYAMLHMYCVSVSEFGKFLTGHGKNF